jgi:hypothetical protein
MKFDPGVTGLGCDIVAKMDARASISRCMNQFALLDNPWEYTQIREYHGVLTP